MLGTDICLVIAGNKIDLEKERNVPIEEAESYVYFFIYSQFYDAALDLNSNCDICLTQKYLLDL